MNTPSRNTVCATARIIPDAGTWRTVETLITQC
jgi:hypothetical protein